MRRFHRLLFVAVTLLLTGCAFGTRYPTLIYPPTDHAGVVASAQAVSAPSLIHPRARIVLNPFIDERSDKKLVGTVRNAYGMRTADVIPKNSVPDWVAQALAQELSQDGYDVVFGNGKTVEEPDVVTVDGQILNVFCDMYFSYTGKVSLLVHVARGGTDLFNRVYTGEGSAGLAFAMTEESYAQSLALALQDVLRQFLADLDASLGIHGGSIQTIGSRPGPSGAKGVR